MQQKDFDLRLSAFVGDAERKALTLKSNQGVFHPHVTVNE